VTIAKQVLKQHQPYEGLWPNDFLPQRVAEAKAKVAAAVEHEVGNL
jgi:acyl-CoA dehydrogenase